MVNVAYYVQSNATQTDSGLLVIIIEVVSINALYESRWNDGERCSKRTVMTMLRLYKVGKSVYNR